MGFEGSYEPALVYFCISLLFLLLGPGPYSVDALIFGKKSGSSKRSSKPTGATAMATERARGSFLSPCRDQVETVAPTV